MGVGNGDRAGGGGGRGEAEKRGVTRLTSGRCVRVGCPCVRAAAV